MVKKEYIKGSLLMVVMSVLFLPLFQESTNVFRERPLKGFFVGAKKPIMIFKNWWTGTYQDSFELSHNEQFGFRNSCVRLHNQIEFELFNQAYTKGVIVGKENYIYDLSYIKAYNGEDFLGDSSINEMTRKIKLLQDTLAKRNITLIIAIAPGKASYFPEYIPDHLLKRNGNTNYNAFDKSFIKSGINYLNFSQWFNASKKSSPYPLYPKTGIHWSCYGATLAVDSIISYTEAKRGVDMPSLMVKSYYLSDSLLVPDDDLGESMNLLYPISPLLMAYPNYGFEDRADKAKVRMLLIADSFAWNLLDLTHAPYTFSEINFWYYNNQVFRSGERSFQGADLTASLETEQNDVVLILSTEANLSKLGWGYIDQAYDHFILKH